MAPDKTKRPMTSDQKRARAIILITFAVIVVFAIGVGWLAVSIGVPPLIAVVIVVVVSAVVSLFMFLEMS